MKAPDEVKAAKAQELISLEKLSEMNPDHIFVQFSDDENADKPDALKDLEKIRPSDHMAFKNPRAAGAMFIGAALAVSGAHAGNHTELSGSPSIMGVSDGSAFIITLCMVLLPQSTSIEMIIYSFIGSAFGAALVFGLVSILPGGFTPVQLAIIGTVTSMLLSSLSAALSIYFQISQDLSFGTVRDCIK